MRLTDTKGTVVSGWTSRLMDLVCGFMDVSPCLMVGFSTASLRIGACAGSNSRLRGPALLFPAPAFTRR